MSYSKPLLVLCDVDGTILMDDGGTHNRATIQALCEVYNLNLPNDAVDLVQPQGKTETRIAREILLSHNLTDAEFEAHKDAWIENTGKLFAAAAPQEAKHWHARPGMAAVLRKLHTAGARLALVTGNLHNIALLRIQLMGLKDIFEEKIGAYGDDAEERWLLVERARQLASKDTSPWPSGRTVVVGDTLRDALAAELGGALAIIFDSPEHHQKDFPADTRIAYGPQELLDALLLLT